jgi:glycosidase
VFRAASNHKYDTADYHHIDPGFGSDADFTRLTQEAARRGIRVIPDASFNHTGSDSLYFDRYGNFASDADGRASIGAFAKGRIHPESPYAAWYRFQPDATPAALPYTGWAGVADLPELDKNADAWRDFAYRSPGSVTRLWLARGASGWRMDVAPWVPDDFWREWRAVVKQTDPQAITIAETWFDASKHLLGDMFDASMNYIFRDAVLDYAAGGPAPAAMRNLELLRELYPPPAFHALMNLLSSHDVARALHRLGAVDGADSQARALALRRFRLALLFQMTYPGAPSVYYGDEVGLAGGDDPYNRAPYPWADLGGQPDTALRETFRQLITLRREQPVLRRGRLDAPLFVDAHVVVQPHRLGRTLALTALNNADAERQLTLTLPPAWRRTRWVDALTGEPLTARAGRLSLTLPATYGRVLLGR